ncbi:ranBP-type and C3HC4-type zinc finger-containing protein 1 [Xenopus laevis]|uniref:RanBP-type and C3HC4-type zinc finger-containing protein 1 n=1 Tax=Xenopus laevis TaxID=8355 RepID=A0A8J1L4Y5_XENLA|nr:ranBP-type and C3HC4-type zinc finger-containing protein 1 [Xenopus laevis]
MASKVPVPLPTVLMSVRAWLGAPGREAVQLQLILGPDSLRDFRLSVRGLTGTVVTDFKLSDVSYEQKSSKCHELLVPGLPGSSIQFCFDDEREAQKWWTVLSSSLRETRKDSLIQGNGGTKPPAVDKPAILGNKNVYKCLSEDAAEVSMDLCTKEDLGLHLSRAIECGDQELALKFAVALAKQKVPLQVQLKQSCYPKTEICMKVGVEDASDSVNISTYVQPHTTVAMLKQQIFREHQFHPSIQRWIIGQCLCSDDRTVASYGIKRDGDTAFLYLLTAKQMKLGVPDPYLSVNPPQPHVSALTKQRSNTLPHRPAPKPNVGQRMEHTGRVNIVDVANKLHLPMESLSLSATPPPAQAGWSCSVCTFINKPTRPGCEMCSSTRPSTYVVPEEYKPDEKERRRLQMEQDSLQQYKKALDEERSQNFQHLLQLDNEVLIPNQEPIECRICFSEVPVGGGVLLRECLHSFCRECLRQLVNCCEEPEVSCPFRDETYGCNSKLQQREIPGREVQHNIRGRQTPAQTDPFPSLSLAVGVAGGVQSLPGAGASAEGLHERLYKRDATAYEWRHCGLLQQGIPGMRKGPAEFSAEDCGIIREGLRVYTEWCRDYDKKGLRGYTDEAAGVLTQSGICGQYKVHLAQTLVQTGEAMYCPVCQIIVQKKDGCDWIRCTMCHTEICWVTKGPRWGPQGPGDTSGGCQCNVNGKKCDPRCQNCH